MNVYVQVLAPEEIKSLEDMAGLAILKTLSRFEFPGEEPEYTEEVAEMIREHELKTTGQSEVAPIGIERLIENDPKFAKALQSLGH